MRKLVAVVVVAVGVLWAGCSGNTDPATNVTSISAQLNAHGHTTGKPATWWWEYSTNQSDLGTAADTEVCGSGTSRPEPDNRCGPAQADNSGDIPLAFVARGLTPSTTYYFRACGQDEGTTQKQCGKVLSFTTSAGNSYVFDRKWLSYGLTEPAPVNFIGIGLSSANNAYVADYSTNIIQENSSTGTFIRYWFSDRPVYVAFDSADNAYVTGANCRCVREYDSTGTLLTQWGSYGTGRGQFSNVQGVAVDASNNVYVVDEATSGRIEKFNSNGGYITEWQPTGAQYLSFPRGIGISPSGNVYVADTDHARIEQFSSTGTFIRAWGSSGAGDGQFSQPAGVAVDSAGNVYVTDATANRVQKFGPTGNFITKFGTSGTADGQFDTPRGIAVDRFDNVYVTDLWGRVQKFKPGAVGPTR